MRVPIETYESREARLLHCPDHFHSSMPSTTARFIKPELSDFLKAYTAELVQFVRAPVSGELGSPLGIQSGIC